MSGSTPELNLKTAVDADDTADYLTLSLADSLRTVDALFSNVTGHVHVGPHQGGAITPAPGSITSSMIADGTITSTDIADQGIANIDLGPDVARANLLTNGGFEIWQRGGGPFTGQAYGADRWTGVPVGTDTISVSRDSANRDSSSGFCAAVNFTLGTGAGQSQLAQPLNNSDNTALVLQTVSFSARVRTSTANAVRVGVFNGSAWTYSAFHPGNGAYATLTVPNVLLGGGTYYYASIFFAATCTAYVDNACLVAGSVPANFVPMHPADDLARCLRYYEVFRATTTISFAPGQVFTTTNAAHFIPMKAIKAITPTVSISSAADWTSSQASSSGAPLSAIGGLAVRADTIGIQTTTSSAVLTPGNASFLQNTNGNAFIAIEANP